MRPLTQASQAEKLAPQHGVPDTPSSTDEAQIALDDAEPPRALLAEEVECALAGEPGPRDQLGDGSLHVLRRRQAIEGEQVALDEARGDALDDESISVPSVRKSRRRTGR